MLIAPWNEIWVTKETAMKLSKRIRNYDKDIMSVLKDSPKNEWADEVAKLEEGLAATRIELGMALTERAAMVMKYEQLEEENEMFQELFVYFFGENYERLK